MAFNPKGYVGKLAETLSEGENGEIDGILAKASHNVFPMDARRVRGLDLALEASCTIGRVDVGCAFKRSSILAQAMRETAQSSPISTLPVGWERTSPVTPERLRSATTSWAVVERQLEIQPEGR
ncbi:hypothetical protein [Methylacidimicrobium sp. B4]|uniref:hypothetical protein n=1 Tax=Methylacidimicrobium sp. B4 TaxID=2796139 RepID=UPI001F5D4F7B|nr:hypothetical protein [Methylacidimicrobium sp. B4]